MGSSDKSSAPFQLQLTSSAFVSKTTLLRNLLHKRAEALIAQLRHMNTMAAMQQRLGAVARPSRVGNMCSPSCTMPLHVSPISIQQQKPRKISATGKLRAAAVDQPVSDKSNPRYMLQETKQFLTNDLQDLFDNGVRGGGVTCNLSHALACG